MQWEMFKGVLLEFGVPSNRLESYYYLFEEYSEKVPVDNIREMRFFLAEIFGQYILVR